MEDEDIRWLYAAYKLGGFKGLPKDMTGAQFDEVVRKFLAMFSDAFLVYGKAGGKPTGVVTIERGWNLSVETHAEWFPWASHREIVEAAAKFVADMRDKNTLLIFSEMKDKHFFEHLCRYSLMKRVGHVSPHFRNGETAVLFQSRRD